MKIGPEEGEEMSTRARIVLVVTLVGLLIAGGTGTAFFLNGRGQSAKASAQSKPAPKPATLTSSSTTEPAPFDPKGAKSWTEWSAKANAQKDQGKLGMWLSCANEWFGGDMKKAYAAVKYQVTKEAVLGLDNFVRTVGKDGMTITNTSPSGNGYRTIANYNLQPGDTYLVWDKDNPIVTDAGDKATVPTESGKEQPAVRRRCGNIIRVAVAVKQAKVVPCPTERNPKATQPVQDNPPELVKKTPGYERGNAEQVVQDQESQPKGGTEPTPHGTPGTGNPGATTPNGSDNGCESPPPSDEPPATDGQGERPSEPIPED